MRQIKALPKKIMSQVSHRFVSPSVLIEQVGIAKGSTVLELGNPVGFFAPSCLRVVGESGSVIVAGPTGESLEKLSHLRHFANFSTCLLADVLVGRAIENSQADIIILTNLLSNSSNPDKFCLALNQYLKPDGQIILIDWDIKSAKVGPDISQRVSKEDAVRMVSQCGLKFVKVMKTPGYHYGLVFELDGK